MLFLFTAEVGDTSALRGVLEDSALDIITFNLKDSDPFLMITSVSVVFTFYI